ncbi:chorismate-binding protein [Aureibacter tunicatorum]|uniref:isochorismate synthase n=1 Tax=Aureibacter tunicatorum TaxID=866807 RepID=A0AAE3XLG9_9BACT|nr:chorismate-binding protein [Aureibacter tunicatorum]MDR6239072.1 isochorismate synthase [Aureibacter tunicatorum]BDD05002.1 hypothetical protein AUTU_24850 [Aureibacter tunicatorum]
METIQETSMANTIFEKMAVIFNAAIEAKLPIAIWRSPNSNTFNTVIQTTKSDNIWLNSIEDVMKQEGFIFAPFNTDSRKIICISSELAYEITESTCTHNATSSVAREFHKTLDFSSLKNSIKYHFPNKGQEKHHSTYKETFINNVKNGIKNINEGSLTKIVPSKTKSIQLRSDFDPLNTFHNLSSSYSNAFISLISIPEIGTWMGATPEILIQVNQNHIFKTVALAGTQLYTGQKLGDVSWKQKEIEEQALVSRYIINRFKKIRLREFDEYGPKTIKAGNLLHLKTSFEVDMKETERPDLPQKMLELLHPTSAVCGMPREEALKFLNNNEKHDRKYFSGFLGPINVQDNSSLFVNLRCMELLEGQAILYAGAGVTEDSDPESEWNETEQKCNTLLNYLQTNLD